MNNKQLIGMIITIVAIICLLYVHEFSSTDSVNTTKNIEAAVIQNQMLGLSDIMFEKKTRSDNEINIRTIRHNGRTYDVFIYRGFIAIERIE